MDVAWGSRSVRGRGNTTNEDAARVWLDQPAVRRAGRGALFAVADGCGTLGRQVAWAVTGGLDKFFDIAQADFTTGSALRTALGAAHEAARAVARDDHGATSGCTLTLVYMTPATDHGLLVAIGDTSAWVLHRRRVHALVTAMDDQLTGGPSRIGVGHPTACHRTLRFAPGDVLLIATRGITDVVPRSTLDSLMALPLHPADLAAEVVHAALGADEDATALAIRFGPCPEARGADDLE